MPKVPVNHLKKQEIVWLGNHKCKHGHTYLEHYSCYLEESPKRERIGFLDIEASNLNASFGIMITYCIKDGGSKKIYHGELKKEDFKKFKAEKRDKRIVKQCIKDILRFDRIVTHYGNSYRFDMPFIRTRAMILKIEFPYYASLIQNDTYPILKSKFNLHSNRLDTACEYIVGRSQKTKIEAKYWLQAVAGDQYAIKKVLQHNKYDVLDTEKLWNTIKDYSPCSNSSL